jgi:hypothetical protein
MPIIWKACPVCGERHPRHCVGPTPEEQLAAAEKLLSQWLEWFSMNPGKLFMAPAGMTRLHLAKSTEAFRKART